MDELYELLRELIPVSPENTVDYTDIAQRFSEKLGMTTKDFYKLQSKYRTLAFTVAGYTSMKVIQTFQEELSKAIKDGISMGEWKSTMNDFLERNGYTKLNTLQAENIFRTNLQTAYNIGAYEEMTRPEVMVARPYWQYDAVEDGRTRQSHLAMDGRVFPADSPVWDIWYPPNGYRCRCSVSSLSEEQVRRMGLLVETEVPDRVDTGMGYIPMIPDRDFGHNPAKVKFNPDLADVPEPLRKAYKRRNQNAPQE